MQQSSDANDIDARLRALGISPDALAARGLRRHAEATELEWVESAPDDEASVNGVSADGVKIIKQFRLTPTAAHAWREMKAAAAAVGVAMMLVSAFRSIARQTQIIEEKLAAGDSLEHILSLVAAPGYSEHHTGRAVDIAIPGQPELEQVFEHTDTFAWLNQHAGRFGFSLSYPRGNADGYQYEPWHWCHDRIVRTAPRVSPPTVR